MQIEGGWRKKIVVVVDVVVAVVIVIVVVVVAVAVETNDVSSEWWNLAESLLSTFFLKSSQRREVDVPQRLSEHKNWSVGAREAFFNPR